MRRDPEITEQDWACTPLAVRSLLFSLRHQLRLLEIRCLADQQEVSKLRAAALQLDELKAQLAGFEKEFADLRQQVIQVEDLKAEISELRERLGQHSRNSSKPPSSDPPSQTKQPGKGLLSRRERKRGPKAGHQGHGRHLKPESEVEHVSQNILKLEQSLWTFVRVEGAQPTNNNAELALRRAVLWRRKSFGTQSKSGSRFVGRILTAVTSLRQQGRDVLEYLTEACAAVLRFQACSGLIPDSAYAPV